MKFVPIPLAGQPHTIYPSPPTVCVVDLSVEFFARVDDRLSCVFADIFDPGHDGRQNGRLTDELFETVLAAGSITVQPQRNGMA